MMYESTFRGIHLLLVLCLLPACGGGGSSGGGRRAIRLAKKIDPRDIVLLDVNQDGKLDIVGVNNPLNVLIVLLNETPDLDPTVTLAPEVNYPTGENPWQVVTADFDGDGVGDVAVTNVNDDNVSIFINDTPASNPTPILTHALDLDLPGALFGHHIAAGDLNADGKIDIALSSGVSVQIFLNETAVPGGAVSFDAGTNLDLEANAQGAGGGEIELADFDGDGKPDLLVLLRRLLATPYDPLVVVLRNTTVDLATTPTFEVQAVPVIGHTHNEGQGIHELTIGDINQDGLTDFVFQEWADEGNTDYPTYQPMINTSTAGSASFSFSPEIRAAGTVVLGDLDGDNAPELCFVGARWRTFDRDKDGIADDSDQTEEYAIAYFPNTTPANDPVASFGGKVSLVQPFLIASPTIVTGDLNGDGAPEVIVGTEDPETIQIVFVP